MESPSRFLSVRDMILRVSNSWQRTAPSAAVRCSIGLRTRYCRIRDAEFQGDKIPNLHVIERSFCVSLNAFEYERPGPLNHETKLLACESDIAPRYDLGPGSGIPIRIKD